MSVFSGENLEPVRVFTHLTAILAEGRDRSLPGRSKIPAETWHSSPTTHRGRDLLSHPFPGIGCWQRGPAAVWFPRKPGAARGGF